MPEPTDDRLIEQINGLPHERERALHYLYMVGNYYIKNTLNAYIRKNGGKAEDAEIICHNAYIIADRNIRANKFRGESALKTYIVGIGKWLWWNKVREKKPKILLDLDPELLVAVEKSVENAYIENERKALVLQAIETLPAKCKEVLLHFDLGYSSPEMTEMFNHPSQKYTENTLYRCLEKLKKMFVGTKNKGK